MRPDKPMDELTIPLKIDANCAPLKLKWIPAGRFKMGDNAGFGFDDWYDNPMGEFEVIITKGYWIGIYPITQSQWLSVMGTTPSRDNGANLPVTEVSWQDAMDFCKRLDVSQLSLPEGYAFSLPTEAQWEYACRAGSLDKYQLGNTVEDLSRTAWHLDNIPTPSTQAVGQKEPNHWGLYDMLGNVAEWCFDCPVEYPDGTVQVDWVGKVGFDGSKDCKFRILRGGAYVMYPDNFSLTCSGRVYGSDELSWWGFRLCVRYMEAQ